MGGGTFAGFLIGLLFGLMIAVVVAVYITRSPVPFVNKAGRAPDRAVDLVPGAELPDPNKPLYSKTRPAGSGQVPETAPVPDAEPERGSILDRLFGRTPERDPAPLPAPVAPPAPPAAEAPKGMAKAPDAQPGSAKTPDVVQPGYLLQAGAFRSQSDADAMRGRLALVGLEARVVSAEVNGQALYRVRVGPYSQLEDMNKARARLAENGIEASVVRQR
ncbi:MAG: SPOR domain-containing protein [Burkholderiaceae bacterium]|nr:SPOR domain-containing protein [Burkholderiaceae bacterium]